MSDVKRGRNILGGATSVIGVEAANVINVSVQLVSGTNEDFAAARAMAFYLADDAAGLTPSTVAPTGGIVIGTDGALIESIANLSGLAISNGSGVLDVDITDTGTPTFYLVLVMADGELAVSGAITFA